MMPIPNIPPEVRVQYPEPDPRRLMGVAFRKIREALQIFRQVPPSYRRPEVDDLVNVLEKYT
jgi:hypothetical protein